MATAEEEALFFEKEAQLLAKKKLKVQKPYEEKKEHEVSVEAKQKVQKMDEENDNNSSKEQTLNQGQLNEENKMDNENNLGQSNQEIITVIQEETIVTVDPNSNTQTTTVQINSESTQIVEEK